MAQPIIDAYAHVGLPRFVSAADQRGIMDANGIERAVLCSFDSSPDLREIHDAITAEPDRFRGLGVPLGRDRAEMEAACRAQLRAGFSGLRLSDADMRERPWLFDLAAAEKKLVIVCGQAASPASARAILDALERHPDFVVIAGHFAGGGTPAALRDHVGALFEHPRFRVVFSRQGGFEAGTIQAWAEAVIARTGWSRVLWGSESPVLFWRNETMAEAIAWIDRLAPSPEDRAAFFAGNTRALYFAAPPTLGPLDLPFAPRDRAVVIPAGIWGRGQPVDQTIAGRLVQGWLAEGGQGRLGDYAQRLLDKVLPPLEGGKG